MPSDSTLSSGLQLTAEVTGQPGEINVEGNVQGDIGASIQQLTGNPVAIRWTRPGTLQDRLEEIFSDISSRADVFEDLTGNIPTSIPLGADALLPNPLEEARTITTVPQQTTVFGRPVSGQSRTFFETSLDFEPIQIPSLDESRDILEDAPDIPIGIEAAPRGALQGALEEPPEVVIEVPAEYFVTERKFTCGEVFSGIDTRVQSAKTQMNSVLQNVREEAERAEDIQNEFVDSFDAGGRKVSINVQEAELDIGSGTGSDDSGSGGGGGGGGGGAPGGGGRNVIRSDGGSSVNITATSGGREDSGGFGVDIEELSLKDPSRLRSFRDRMNEVTSSFTDENRFQNASGRANTIEESISSSIDDISGPRSGGPPGLRDCLEGFESDVQDVKDAADEVRTLESEIQTVKNTVTSTIDSAFEFEINCQSRFSDEFNKIRELRAEVFDVDSSIDGTSLFTDPNTANNLFQSKKTDILSSIENDSEGAENSCLEEARSQLSEIESEVNLNFGQDCMDVSPENIKNQIESFKSNAQSFAQGPDNVGTREELLSNAESIVSSIDTAVENDELPESCGAKLKDDVNGLRDSILDAMPKLEGTCSDRYPSIEQDVTSLENTLARMQQSVSSGEFSVDSIKSQAQGILGEGESESSIAPLRQRIEENIPDRDGNCRQGYIDRLNEVGAGVESISGISCDTFLEGDIEGQVDSVLTTAEAFVEDPGTLQEFNTVVQEITDLRNRVENLQENGVAPSSCYDPFLSDIESVRSDLEGIRSDTSADCSSQYPDISSNISDVESEISSVEDTISSGSFSPDGLKSSLGQERETLISLRETVNSEVEDNHPCKPELLSRISSAITKIDNNTNQLNNIDCSNFVDQNVVNRVSSYETDVQNFSNTGEFSRTEERASSLRSESESIKTAINEMNALETCKSSLISRVESADSTLSSTETVVAENITCGDRNPSIEKSVSTIESDAEAMEEPSVSDVSSFESRVSAERRKIGRRATPDNCVSQFNNRLDSALETVRNKREAQLPCNERFPDIASALGDLQNRVEDLQSTVNSSTFSAGDATSTLDTLSPELDEIESNINDSISESNDCSTQFQNRTTNMRNTLTTIRDTIDNADCSKFVPQSLSNRLSNFETDVKDFSDAPKRGRTPSRKATLKSEQQQISTEISSTSMPERCKENLNGRLNSAGSTLDSTEAFKRNELDCSETSPDVASNVNTFETDVENIQSPTDSDVTDFSEAKTGIETLIDENVTRSECKEKFNNRLEVAIETLRTKKADEPSCSEQYSDTASNITSVNDDLDSISNTIESGGYDKESVSSSLDNASSELDGIEQSISDNIPSDSDCNSQFSTAISEARSRVSSLRESISNVDCQQFISQSLRNRVSGFETDVDSFANAQKASRTISRKSDLETEREEIRTEIKGVTAPSTCKDSLLDRVSTSNTQLQSVEVFNEDNLDCPTTNPSVDESVTSFENDIENIETATEENITSFSSRADSLKSTISEDVNDGGCVTKFNSRVDVALETLRGKKAESENCSEKYSGVYDSIEDRAAITDLAVEQIGQGPTSNSDLLGAVNTSLNQFSTLRENINSNIPEDDECKSELIDKLDTEEERAKSIKAELKVLVDTEEEEEPAPCSERFPDLFSEAETILSDANSVSETVASGSFNVEDVEESLTSLEEKTSSLESSISSDVPSESGCSTQLTNQASNIRTVIQDTRTAVSNINCSAKLPNSLLNRVSTYEVDVNSFSEASIRSRTPQREADLREEGQQLLTEIASTEAPSTCLDNLSSRVEDATSTLDNTETSTFGELDCPTAYPNIDTAISDFEELAEKETEPTESRIEDFEETAQKLKQSVDTDVERVDCTISFDNRVDVAVEKVRTKIEESLSCSEKYPGVAEELEELSTSVEEFDTLLSTGNFNISDANSTLSDLKSSASGLKTQINANIPSEDNCKSEFTNQVESLETRLDEMNPEQAQDRCGTLVPNRVNNRVGNLESDVTGLENANPAATSASRKQSLQTELSSLRTTISDLNVPDKCKTSLNERLDKMETRLEGVETREDIDLTCDQKNPQIATRVDDFESDVRQVSQPTETDIQQFNERAVDLISTINEASSSEKCKVEFSERIDGGLERLKSTTRQQVRVVGGETSDGLEEEREQLEELRSSIAEISIEESEEE